METINLNQALKPTFNLLKITFGAVPIIAGADKFFNLLTNWAEYVPASIAGILPFSATVLMMIVGVIEIVAGLIVFKKTEIGGYIVAAWLTVIALVLLVGFKHVDVAVRDLVMAVAALSMARMAKFMA
jgi:hypothetical protein